MPGQVLNEVKKKRAAEIALVQEEFSAEFLSGFIGKEDKVLIETEEGEGHTDRYAKVLTTGKPNEIVNVKIVSVSGDTLIGERI